MNKYKSQFPESYALGRASFSISISREAFDLLSEKRIGNASAFINDLLISSLRSDSFLIKKALEEFEAAKESLIKEGFIVTATVQKVIK